MALDGTCCPCQLTILTAKISRCMLGIMQILFYCYAGHKKIQFVLHCRHTGGAVGASSVLLIRPGSEEFVQTANASGTLPKGIVVAMIANQENVGLSETAMKIAGEFKFMLDVPPSKPRAQAHDLDKLEGKDIVTL